MPSKQYNNCLCAFTLYWGTCDWEYKEDVWAVCEHTAVPWRDLSMHTDICRDSRTSHRQMPREDCTFTDYWKWNNLYSSPASHWRKQPVQKRAAVVSVTVIPGLRRLGQEICHEFETSLGYSLRSYLTYKKGVLGQLSVPGVRRAGCGQFCHPVLRSRSDLRWFCHLRWFCMSPAVRSDFIYISTGNPDLWIPVV